MEGNSNSSPNKNMERTLKCTLAFTIVCAVLSLIGAGFGIYGTIRAEHALELIANQNEAFEDEGFAEDIEEYTYGKPASADEIDFVSISYNDDQDYIDILKEDNSADYYAYDQDGEYIGNTTEIDTSDIFKYIFDQDLNYLSDSNEYEDDYTWSIEVSSSDGTSHAEGSGAEPEWFTDLLRKLDVDNKGFFSKK